MIEYSGVIVMGMGTVMGDDVVIFGRGNADVQEILEGLQMGLGMHACVWAGKIRWDSVG